MGKLAVLKFGEGDFDRGFSVTLQIGEDGSTPSVEITAKLTQAPTITAKYQEWQLAYRGLGLNVRLEDIAEQITNVNIDNLTENLTNPFR